MMMMRKICFKNTVCSGGLVLVAALSAWALAGVAMACDVPVFRYALERWEASPYTAVVFHDGPLSAEDKIALGLLANAAEDKEHPANLIVKTVDTQKDLEGAAEELYLRACPAKLPWVAVLEPQEFPGMVGDEMALGFRNLLWGGPLELGAAQRLVDSPKRREIARRLLQGDSAVWLLVESGDKAKDDAAAELIAENLKKVQVEMKDALRPTDDSDRDPNSPAAGDMTAAVPLKVAFSLVRMSRSEAGEDVLAEMLQSTDTRGEEGAPEPVAFIIFGRGRILAAFPGKQIGADQIFEASGFCLQDCSCVIKDNRPGMDMLMAVDWEGLLSGELVVDKALPPLTGVMPSLPVVKPASADEAAEEAQPATEQPSATAAVEESESAPAEGRGLVRNVAFAMVVLLAAAGLGTLAMRKIGGTP
jgi:hypothetical protein